jgi:hypothetical protein
MTRLAPRLARRRAVLPAAAIAVALAFGLSACNAAENTGAAMHTSVVQIAARAAAGDYAGALAELALLDRDVAAALDAGRIDADREQEIRAAMELVRADLQDAEVATTPTPTPTTPPTTDPAVDDGDDQPGNSDNKGKGTNDDKGKDKDDD